MEEMAKNPPPPLPPPDRKGPREKSLVDRLCEGDHPVEAGLRPEKTVRLFNVSDAEAMPDLLQGAPGKIEQVSADGGYDQRKCNEILNEHDAKAVIPPRKGAKIWQHANTKAERHARDENLRRIRKIGLKEWKRESNYNRRSLAETQVFRFKTIFGDRLQTRQIDNQFKDLMLKSAILNRLTRLGMPDSVKVIG
jgi:IS5 family transposase